MRYMRGDDIVRRERWTRGRYQYRLRRGHRYPRRSSYECSRSRELGSNSPCGYPIAGHRCRALAAVSDHEARRGSGLFVSAAAVVSPLRTDAFRAALTRATSEASRKNKLLEREIDVAAKEREVARLERRYCAQRTDGARQRTAPDAKL
jgi:hypothetical protein